MAVYLRLARAEQVEIGARQDEDDGKLGQRPGFRLRGCALSLYGLHGKRQRRAMAVVSIILNGDERQVRKGSIADLVAALGLDVTKVARSEENTLNSSH